VEVLTVPFSPTTAELFPPMASHVTVEFVPAKLVLQTALVFASQVAVRPLDQPWPAVAPLLSMYMVVCARATPPSRHHTARQGKIELRRTCSSVLRKESRVDIGELNKHDLAEIGCNLQVVHTGA